MRFYLIILVFLLVINGVSAIETCDWSINLDVPLITKDFNFSINITKIYGNKTNMVLYRSIEDYEGSIIKEYDNLTLEVTRKRTLFYTPNLRKDNFYFVKVMIDPSCSDNNSENNFVIKPFYLIGEGKSKDSKIELEKIYDLGKDGKAEWGKLIRVKLNVYKGDTTKNVVWLWIENNNKIVSKKAKISLEEKYHNYNLTIPLQINNNCKEKFDDGEYKIRAEGFDKEDELEILIKDFDKNACKREIKKIIVKNITKIVKKEIIYNSYNESNINQSENPIIYESRGVKARRSALYFFCVVLILFTLIIMIENGRRTKNKD